MPDRHPRDPTGPPFRHGVASGDPLSDRVILWTRVTTTEESVPVRWIVARDEDLDDVVVSGETSARGDHDHTVKLDVPGLSPATTHGYVVLDVTRERVRAEWWMVDTVLERTDGERLASAWEVREGTSRLYEGVADEEV